MNKRIYKELTKNSADGNEYIIRYSEDGSEEDIALGIVPEIQISVIDKHLRFVPLFVIPLSELKEILP